MLTKDVKMVTKMLQNLFGRDHEFNEVMIDMLKAADLLKLDEDVVTVLDDEEISKLIAKLVEMHGNIDELVTFRYLAIKFTCSVFFRNYECYISKFTDDADIAKASYEFSVMALNGAEGLQKLLDSWFDAEHPAYSECEHQINETRKFFKEGTGVHK